MSFADVISKDRGQPATIRIGTVASINPLIVTLQQTQMRGVGLLANYSPAVGDVVVLLGQSAVSADGSSWLALGHAVGSDFVQPVWASYTPVWSTSGVAPVLGNGTLIGRYRQVGRSTLVQIRFVAGGTTTFGTGVFGFSMPPGLGNAAATDAIGSAILLDASATRYSASVEVPTGDNRAFIVAGATNYVTGVNPFAFVATDAITLQVEFQA